VTRIGRQGPGRLSQRASVDIHPPDLLELVAHELRTPVTSLYGATQLLRDRELSSMMRTDLVSEMAQDAARLVRFLDDLLALAEATSGGVRTEPVLVQRVVEDVTLGLLAEHPATIVAVHRAADVPAVSADPTALRHALVNLLGHAVRAAPAGSVVRLGIERIGDQVVTTIRERALPSKAHRGLIDRGDPLVAPGGRLWHAAAQALVLAMGGRLDVVRRGEVRTMRLSLRVVPSEE